MKSITWKQLGRSWEKKSANTFDEIVLLAQSHGREMLQWIDIDHIKAMYEMSKILKNKDEM